MSHHIKSRIGTSGLFLGYELTEKASFGFRSMPSRDGQQLITYGGDGHLLTVAPTGRGKGVSVIIPTLLTYPGPVVVFDPKGENFLVTARRRRELGQQVVKLDPFRVVEGDSDCLNPFDRFTLANADLETDAQSLAETLSATCSLGAREPFWDLQGCALSGAVIAHVAEGRPPVERHLGTVREILTADDTVYGLAVALDTVGKEMNRFSYSEIASFLQMPDITRGGVLATANSYIKAYASQRVLATLERSTLSLQDVVDGKPLTIYLIIPPDKLISHKSLYKLWVETLLKAITSRKQIPPLRTLFLLDECAQMGHFPELLSLITLCRGYGVQCHTFWQDLSQIQSHYQHSWETILDNAAVIQVFGVGNYSMANQWAGFLNRSPAELAQLSHSEQILFLDGVGDMRCRKLNYLRDQMFQGRYDHTPFFEQRPGVARTQQRGPGP